MDFNGIGYSNIRLPNDTTSYVYTYNSYINTFPEEVFIHEFLHTMERISADNGYKFPILHDHEKYGYKIEPRTGLKEWYRNYMSNTIKMSHGITTGLNPNVYYIKPVHKSAFEYSMEIEFDNDPDNIIEDIKCFFNMLFNTGKTITMEGNENI